MASAVESAPSQKHLGLILDTKLCFVEHLNQKISKANKGIGTIKRLRNYLPRNSLLTIYKSLIRPHLDYGDVILISLIMRLLIKKWNLFNIMLL